MIPSNTISQTPFLRTSRKFPKDPHLLEIELSRTYLDLATQINSREIGIYQTRPINSGQAWGAVFQGLTNQALRQVFSFSDTTLTIDHNIKGNFVVTRAYGAFVSGSTQYSLPYIDVINVTNQISFSVTSTQILIVKGAGSPPIIDSGKFILEWLQI